MSSVKFRLCDLILSLHFGSFNPFFWSAKSKFWHLLWIRNDPLFFIFSNSIRKLLDEFFNLFLKVWTGQPFLMVSASNMLQVVRELHPTNLAEARSRLWNQLHKSNTYQVGSFHLSFFSFTSLQRSQVVSRSVEGFILWSDKRRSMVQPIFIEARDSASVTPWSSSHK